MNNQTESMQDMHETMQPDDVYASPAVEADQGDTLWLVDYNYHTHSPFSLYGNVVFDQFAIKADSIDKAVIIMKSFFNSHPGIAEDYAFVTIQSKDKLNSVTYKWIRGVGIVPTYRN